MTAPTKISQLDRTERVQQIFRLDISVDHIFAMNILKSLRNLVNVVCSSGLIVT
jgi:hypothetical protein